MAAMADGPAQAGHYDGSTMGTCRRIRTPQSQQADAFDPLRGRDGIGFVDLGQASRHSISSGRRDVVKDDPPAVLAP